MTDVVASDVQAMARRHANPPHDWWDKRDPGRVWQTVPYTNNARARLSVPGMETNHRGFCYQLEMNDRAVDGDTYTDRQLEDLAVDVIVPMSALYGLPLVAYRARGEQSETAYGVGSRTRMTATEWLTATKADGSPWGWCLHQNVPGQSHWDGPIDMGRLMAIAREIAQDNDKGDDMSLTVHNLRNGEAAYRLGEEWAVRFVQQVLSLPAVGTYDGRKDGKPSGQLDQAVADAKGVLLGREDASPVMGADLWRAIVAQAAQLPLEPAIVERTIEADCSKVEAELAKARGELAVALTKIANASDALG